MYKRNLLVCVIILVGFLAATLALADDYGYRKWYSRSRAVPVEVSPREPVQTDGAAQGTVDEPPARIVFFDNDPETPEPAIPDGQRLVMQHVSLASLAGGGEGTQVNCNLNVNREGLPRPILLRLRVTKQLGGASDDSIAEGPVTFYAEAGDTVAGVCRAFDSANEPTPVSTLGTLVGYLVDVKKRKHDDD